MKVRLCCAELCCAVLLYVVDRCWALLVSNEVQSMRKGVSSSFFSYYPHRARPGQARPATGQPSMQHQRSAAAAERATAQWERDRSVNLCAGRCTQNTRSAVVLLCFAPDIPFVFSFPPVGILRRQSTREDQTRSQSLSLTVYYHRLQPSSLQRHVISCDSGFSSSSSSSFFCPPLKNCILGILC